MILPQQFEDSAVVEIFSDAAFVRALLQVEATLAVAEAHLGIIPQGAAQTIVQGALALQTQVNMERLLVETERNGVPIIELVRQLRDHVGPEAAQFVHWGATTQDILDTALVLQMRDAFNVIEPMLHGLIANLSTLADKYRRTLMVGRTHSQHALPITFGLKVATWLAPVLRHRDRLSELMPRTLVVQFGGAAGTLASLGELGLQVQTMLAQELALGVPLLPWHTQRDGLAEVANWLSLITGSLAKMAQDIILMAQSEVGELNETSDPTRGGSSTMPQKSNPIVSERIVAAARMNASLLANMHHALIQEHERGTHGWQLEWLSLPQMFSLTSGVLKDAAFLSKNLVVNEARMGENIRASNGLMLAERLSFALTPMLGRDGAKRSIQEACQIAVRENKNLVDVVHERTNAALNWDELKDESSYLGETQPFIDRVIRKAANGSSLEPE